MSYSLLACFQSVDSSTFELPDLSAHFPNLSADGTKKLSKEDLLYLMINLDKHTEKMNIAFASLVRDLEEHLTKHDRRPEVVRYLEMINRKLYRNLSECASISEITSELSENISFFNYDIIKFLIQKFGSNSNKERLRKYKKMFREYSKRRIVECPSNAFGSAYESEKVWVLKTDKTLENLTAKDVKLLQYEVNKILYPSHQIVRLLQVEKGCVRLIFRGFGEGNLKISALKKQALRNVGILRISWGNHCEDFSKIEDKEYGESKLVFSH